MTNDTAKMLASCLDAVEQQGLSLEECVAQHPDQRVVLRELLPVAQVLRSAPLITPSLDFRMDARQRLLARLPARRSRHATGLLSRVAVIRVAFTLVAIMTLATSVVTASAQALPNDALYPVKRTIEQARLALAADNVHSGDLRLTFAAERLEEVKRLIDMGRGADVAVAVDDFATQMQSVVSLTQTISDTTERTALLARVAASIETYDAVLATTQARLPESGQAAVTRARAVLAKHRENLRMPQPAAPLTIPIDPVPDRTTARQRTPTLPTAAPTAWLHPTAIPTHASTQRPVDWATQQPRRAPSVSPAIRPTRSPAAFETAPLVTRLPRWTWLK